MEELKSKKTTQEDLLKDFLNNCYFDNQSISDDYLNKNFKIVYTPL